MEEALAELIGQVGLRAVIWEEDWVDLGYPWKILEANAVVMDRWRQARIDRSVRFHGSVKVEGPVRIERDVVIDNGSVIKGPCFIGAGTYIGNNALVRHYTAIGPGAVVGYGVELKNCVVFSRSMIGRLSFIGDSVVGENVDIGSGTMTVNVDLAERTIQVPVGGRAMDTGLKKLGSFIGDGARIGASNTLAAGSIIAPAAIVPHHFSYGSDR
jgi:bifunctional UDP-N-acetylglucosamine pyrophosphorylase/glucosamine-1-phosphate N-acetyltransferase